jgi:hypothetical protein
MSGAWNDEFKNLSCGCLVVWKTNPLMKNLIGELVLEMVMNEMWSWKPSTWVRLVLLGLEGHVKVIFKHGSLSHEWG